MSAPATQLGTSVKQPERSSLLARIRKALEDEAVLGYLFLIPTLVVVLGLIGYPFGLSLVYSFSDKRLGSDSFSFVWLRNYTTILADPIFRRTLLNTFNYSVTAVFFKIVFGLLMALTLNGLQRGRRLFRGLLMLPWVIPSSLSVLVWVVIFDPQYSVITWILRSLGLVDGIIPWFGDMTLAMLAVQIVNIWRGIPFFGMIIMAALVTVPEELYEAATVDGANGWRRFWAITFPHILPVMLVAALYSFIQTMGDFQIVWILTNGGPQNATHLIATYAYRIAIPGTNIAQGAAIAAFLFPVLALIIALQVRYLRKEA